MSAIALPYHGSLCANQAGLGQGLRLLDLSPLLTASGQKLGEGAFACVFAVDCPGLPPLCVKWYKEEKRNAHWHEAHSMAQVEHIPHLPRLVGICPQPPAVLMTRHGAMTLQ